MKLTTKQICSLRGLAHPLNPAVQMGKSGYSESFVTEVSRNLNDHELIKVRLSADERTEFVELAGQLAEDTASRLIATVGRIAVLYKRSAKVKIKI